MTKPRRRTIEDRLDLGRDGDAEPSAGPGNQPDHQQVGDRAAEEGHQRRADRAEGDRDDQQDGDDARALDQRQRVVDRLELGLTGRDRAGDPDDVARLAAELAIRVLLRQVDPRRAPEALLEGEVGEHRRRLPAGFERGRGRVGNRDRAAQLAGRRATARGSSPTRPGSFDAGWLAAGRPRCAGRRPCRSRAESRTARSPSALPARRRCARGRCRRSALRHPSRAAAGRSSRRRLPPPRRPGSETAARPPRPRTREPPGLPQRPLPCASRASDPFVDPREAVPGPDAG